MARNLPAGEGSRLHRFSFFFVLLARLWNLAPLLLAAFFLGRSDRYDGWELIGTVSAAVALSLYSLIYTLSFRFWLLDDEIVIKKGIFDRTLRHIPYSRISNIAHKQNLLHRIFGVVELNLESGSGAQSEAKLTVLTKAQAADLEQKIRSCRVDSAPEAGLLDSATDQIGASPAVNLASMPVNAEGTLLSQTRFGDLVRLGLISNRGMLLVGGAVYFLSQTGLAKNNLSKSVGTTVDGWFGGAHDTFFWFLSAVIFISLIIVVVRLASIVVAIVQFYDFKLSATAENLRTESGLLTRRGGQARIERVALVVINNSWLHRLFSRQSMQVFLPGNTAQGDSMERSGMTHLTPVATESQVNALVERIFDLQISALRWRPLAAKAGLRMAKKALFFGALFWLPVLIIASLKTSGVLFAGICAGAPITFIWLYFSRHKDARESGYVLLPDFWIIKTGYFSQTIQLVRRDAIQSASLISSHFDRTTAMAGVQVDLMVSSTSTTPKIAYLNQNDAATLFQALRDDSKNNDHSETARSRVENASAVSAGA